mgnify:CR=1 FL=1
MDENKQNRGNLNKDLNENSDEKLSGWVVGIIMLFLLGCVVFSVSLVTSAIFNGDDNNSSTVIVEKEEETYSDYDAYVNAQMILENFLKSPSTAEYPVASKATIKRYTDDGFRVESYVDSQNGFGAVIRSDWIVVFQFVEDSVKVLAVVLDGETLYKSEE